MKLLVTGGAGFLGSDFFHHMGRDGCGDGLVVVGERPFPGRTGNP